MKASITSELQAEQVNITDMYGDGRHVSIDVVASSFEVRAWAPPHLVTTVPVSDHGIIILGY